MKRGEAHVGQVVTYMNPAEYDGNQVLVFPWLIGLPATITHIPPDELDDPLINLYVEPKNIPPIKRHLYPGGFHRKARLRRLKPYLITITSHERW